MKVGDLVEISPEAAIFVDMHYGIGVITDSAVYGETGEWFCVQWADDILWHRPTDLIMINESW